MNSKDKYKELSDIFIAPNGSAKIKLETRNKIEHCYHVTGQDNSRLFDGIKWKFPLNLFDELDSNENTLQMTFNIKSTQDIVLNVNMNYESDAGTILSVEQGKIILKANEPTSIEKHLALHNIPNAVRAVPVIMLVATNNANFYISNVAFKPIINKIARFAGSLSNPEANGSKTQLQVLKYLDDRWTTALVLPNVAYGGLKYTFNKNDLVGYVDEIKHDVLYLSFDLLTSVATSINVNLNLSNSNDELISSTPLTTFNSQADEIAHHQVALPTHYDSSVKTVQVIIMNVAGNATSFKISLNNLDIKANSQSIAGNVTTNNRLPIVKLTGDTSLMSKDQKVMLQFELNDHGRVITGYSNTKWQGDSSLKYPKKAYKIKLYEDEQGENKKKFVPFAGWKSDNEFNLKANYNEATFGRNVVNSGLFADITANRHGLRKELVGTDSFATVKGQPVLVYINDEFAGLYTFNTTKDVYMNMDKANDDHIVIGGTQWTDTTLFNKDVALLDGSDFEIIQNAGHDDDTRTKFNRLMKFVNSSTDEEFKEHASEYLDIPSMIDWMAFVMMIQGEDSLGKNTTFATWDGKIWSATAYDLDTSWSMFYDGTKLVDPSQDLFDFHGNKLYQRIFAAFKDEFKTRYAELRNTVMTPANILDKFVAWYYAIGEENYEAEQKRWNAPSFGVTSLAQLKSDIPLRLLAVDEQVEAK